MLFWVVMCVQCVSVRHELIRQTQIILHDVMRNPFCQPGSRLVNGTRPPPTLRLLTGKRKLCITVHYRLELVPSDCRFLGLDSKRSVFKMPYDLTIKYRQVISNYLFKSVENFSLKFTPYWTLIIILPISS